MAKNFWEAQKRARSRTGVLLLLFAVLAFVVASLVELGMRALVEDYAHENIPWIGIFFGLLIVLAAGFQYINFKLIGGSYVAESLGAKLVHPNTTNLKKKQLLNIVEEMAVASSLPVPPVYLMPAQEINAFAAGLTPDSAVITVTEGALDRLSRDELQGVIAHEIGHIYNGDMTVSLRLAALLMGFFFVLYFGLRLLQFFTYQRQEENRKGPNPIIIMAILFVVAGILTWFFGSILKAAISREREYLADACSVQFTRNPEGIANALRKIAQDKVVDMPRTGASYAHLYLNHHSMFGGLFDTHPPIRKRLEAILGREYIPPEWNIP